MAVLLTDQLQPYGLKQDCLALQKESPPRIARSLYVLLQDPILLGLDPSAPLTSLLEGHRQFRLADAKLLTVSTPFLSDVARPVLDRFLQLVATAPIPYGTTSIVLPEAAGTCLLVQDPKHSVY